MILNCPRKCKSQKLSKKVCCSIEREWNPCRTQIFPQRKLEVLTDGLTGRVYQTSCKLNSHVTQTVKVIFKHDPMENTIGETAGRWFLSPKQVSYTKALQHLRSLGVSHGPGGCKGNQGACEWTKDLLAACAEHASGVGVGEGQTPRHYSILSQVIWRHLKR